MRKKIALLAVLSVFTFIGCGSGQSALQQSEMVETKEINFSVPDGLPAIANAKNIKENPEIKDGYKVNYTIEKNSESLVTSVMKGEPDVVIVPSNVASTVYNKTKNYKIAGTVGWGSLYVGTTDKNVSSDFKGKEIYNIGKGLTPDLVSKSIFMGKGIDVDKDINFSYVNGVSELAPVILSGKAEYAVIPEPALSTVQTKNSEFTTLMDLNEEWKKINNTEYGFPQSTLIVKNDLLENDKEFVDGLLDKVKESTEWMYDNKDALGDYCEEIGVSAKKTIITKAVDRANIKYVPIKDCKKEYKTYFEKLNELDSSTIGGSIPDEGVFMEK
ncbi:MqnA/MqnD/SBP family protein [Clostridium sp. SM-530-WT-3G]|uniref:ABC transporter substrate-binding protein n=1 Tax=Clostridium sp. SM-530-WT-3G TaxID=2725303 RepID=UPI00145F6B9F|nr:MqnA/MqnD/SBP family protein [Clostridium sp. SM-530-WT-3G]NME83878.1 ABC transporter substrate-binding protein [Clostridium sp. SM-530-WT-3G]